MSTDHDKALGRKVAFNRKRRGLSQKDLASLLNRSETWISQVERGVRQIDRMTVLEKVAEVLGLPVPELAAETPVVAATTTPPPGTNRLRLALSTAHSLNALLDQHETPNLPTLRADTERAWTLAHEGNCADLVELLEKLIPQTEFATRSAPEENRPELFRTLATVYHACGAALATMGEQDAAWIAVDRSIVAAERANDPLLMAAGAFRLSIIFLGSRRYDQAAQISASAADALRQRAETGDIEAVALRGALTLQRAVAASHANEADAAYEYIRQAREMAARVGPGRNDYDTEFGPANVDLHEVAVAVDLGDAGAALRTAECVDASGLSSERQTRFHLDVARAHTQRRQVTEAVLHLRSAHDLSPEIMETMPAVKQLVSDLVTMSQDAPPDGLRSLTRELGVEESLG